MCLPQCILEAHSLERGTDADICLNALEEVNAVLLITFLELLQILSIRHCLR